LVVAFCGCLLFLFVPETYWDRSTHPKKNRKSNRPGFPHRHSRIPESSQEFLPSTNESRHETTGEGRDVNIRRRSRSIHVGFTPGYEPANLAEFSEVFPPHEPRGSTHEVESNGNQYPDHSRTNLNSPAVKDTGFTDGTTSELDMAEPTHISLPSPQPVAHLEVEAVPEMSSPVPISNDFKRGVNSEAGKQSQSPTRFHVTSSYTTTLRGQPARSFVEQLSPFNGRLASDKWIKVAIRPFFLYAYPAVLWSAAVYACSVGWLIVISESVAVIYREGTNYRFDALQTGLIYLSPFIGGILGTAVAGKVSDVIVGYMARCNGGLYEPEFRLVMVIPVAITTGIGLMGFGWSAEIDDAWIVPTVFFGLVSFGCSLGSTTSITFCVDSYRQYAGEALVTLNFTKNIFHGLVFSLFVTGWITASGPREVYIVIGVIQMVVLLSTIPMYIYGKRARMWTVRKNLMEKF
jgi:hypothetical protein